MTEARADIIRAFDRGAAVLRRLGLGRVTRLGRRVFERVLRQGVAVDVHGIRLVGGVRDRAFLYRVKDGAFEPQTVERFLQLVRPGAVVLDVGAYLGYYTVLASRLLEPGGMVYAFEPDPGSFHWLQQNVRINRCQNVVAFQKGLASSTGPRYLYRHGTDLSKSSLSARKGWEQRLSVETDTADRLVDVAEVNVVKIDVEGAEVAVLEGMAGLIVRSLAPCLVVELNPAALVESGSSADALLLTLGRLGFTRIERLDEQIDATGRLELCNLCCRREHPGE